MMFLLPYGLCRALGPPLLTGLILAAIGCEARTVDDDATGSSRRPMVVAEFTEIAGYRAWKTLTREPYWVSTTQVTDCIAGTRAGPHDQRFVHVYINDLAHSARAPVRMPFLPGGSVIVKEKLERADSKSPAAVAVMLKREPGFDEEGRDWEYFYFEGPDLKLVERGLIANCRDCHVKAPADCTFQVLSSKSNY